MRLRRGERRLRLLIQDLQGKQEEVVEESLELEHLGEKVMKEMTRQASYEAFQLLSSTKVRLEALRLEMPGKEEDFYARNVRC